MPLTPLTISGPFTLSAASIVSTDAGHRLVFTVRLTNASTASEQVEYGGCWAFVRLFESAALAGNPVFDSGVVTTGCLTSLTKLTIAGNDSAALVGSYDVPSILAAGVAPGKYFVAVALAPNGTPQQLAAGQVEIEP